MNNNFFSKFGQIRNEHYPWLYVTTETLGRTGHSRRHGQDSVVKRSASQVPTAGSRSTCSRGGGSAWGETPEITVETRLKYRKIHNNEMLMYVDIAFDLNKSIQEIIKYKKV